MPQAVAGYVSPGDLVNIYMTTKGDQSARLLVSHVPVLAIVGRSRLKRRSRQAAMDEWRRVRDQMMGALQFVALALGVLFVVAIAWLVCSIALTAYRAGRRRGP